MSRIRAAAEMMKNLPGRGQNISRQVLGKNSPGGLLAPNNFGAVQTPMSKFNALARTGGGTAIGAFGAADLTEDFTESAKLQNSIFSNPEELGRKAARAKMSLEEIMDNARQEAERIGNIPQFYFIQIQSGYKDEMKRQNPNQIYDDEELIYDEDIEGGARPVSLVFAGGGEASSQHMMPDGTPMPGSNHQEYEAMMMQQRQMMAGGGTPFPDLTGDGKITQADILKGRGVYAVGGEAIGDELEGMEMTEEQAMAELEESRGEFEQLQMLADVVKKLLNEGMGEAEIVAYLKEQGLDDEDIETLFSFLQEISGQESSMEQAPQGIDQQLQGMM